MKQYYLQEDKLPPKLDVRFSSKISKVIHTINDYNQNNTEGLNQWRDYLKGMISYISNSAIGWDNTDRYKQKSKEGKNGSKFIWDFNIDPPQFSAT